MKTIHSSQKEDPNIEVTLSEETREIIDIIPA